MKKMINRASLAALFTSAFTLVLALAPSSAWAGGTGGGTTYYARATVQANDSARGKVYVNTTSTKGTKTTVDNNTETEDNRATFVFYRWAEANPGYVFKGWSDGSMRAADTGVITSEKTDKNNPETRTWTATFELLCHFYGQVTVQPNDASKGTVYVGTTDTPGTLVDGSVTADQMVDDGESGTKMTFYRWAAPKPGYYFAGWSDGSENANDSVTLASTSQDSGSPASASYTANFEEANTYYGRVTVKPNDSSMGTVYVGVTDDSGSPVDTEMTQTSSCTGGERYGKLVFYRRAVPKAGYVFRGWSDGGNVRGAATMITTSNDQSAPTEQTWTAVFSAGDASSLQGTAAQFSFDTTSPFHDDWSDNGSQITIDKSSYIDSVNVRQDSKGNGALTLGNGGRNPPETYSGQLGNLAYKPSMAASGSGWTIAAWVRPDMENISLPGMAKNEWAHICLVYDPEMIRAWQNGYAGRTRTPDPVVIYANYRYPGGGAFETSVPAKNLSTALGYVPFSINSNGSFTLGGTLITGVNGSSPTTGQFRGLMDDVVFINRPLTQIETAHLYNTGETYVIPGGEGIDAGDTDAAFDTPGYRGQSGQEDYSWWSSFKAPTADNDYLVDNGYTLRKQTSGTDVEFAGRSLTLGRLQPLSYVSNGSRTTRSKVGNFQWNSTGTLTIRKLVLNNGTMSNTKGALAGSVIVQSPESAPYAWALGGALTINAPMTAAGGTALSFTGGQTLTFGAGSLANYAGAINATNNATRLAFTEDPMTLSSIRVGGASSSATSGLRGSTGGTTVSAPVTSVSNRGRLFVASDETLTLKGALTGTLNVFNNAGTPAQTSCGTVVLDGTTGAGTVSLGTSGTVAVKTAGAAANVGTVAGGTVAIESGLGAVTLAQANVTGNMTISMALNNGTPDAVTIPTVTEGRKVTFALSGTLPTTAATYTIATLPAGTSYEVTNLPNLGDDWGVIPAMDENGIVTLQVALKPSIAEAMVAIPSKTFSGAAQQPVPVVTLGGYTAVAGTDYTFSVEGSPSDAGDYTVTLSSVTGGFFKPDTSTTATYTIAPRQISSAVLSATSKVYNRAVQKPTATVKYSSTTLTLDTHYTISYGEGNYTDVGTYTVTVDGIGNYAGTINLEYKITPYTTIYLSANPAAGVYNGEIQHAELVIREENNTGPTLVEGVDYQVAYSPSEPKLPGEYTMTITGIGNYAGANLSNASGVNATFKIWPADLYVDGVNGSDDDGNVGADPANPCKTISAAVAAVNTANLTTPITIHVAPGTYVENIPTITSPMTIVGEGATRDDVIVDGNAANRVFYINNVANAVIANLTMRNGKAPSGQDGGTLYLNAGTVTNCVLKGGNLTSGTRNGAIAYMTTGTALLVDSLILGEGEVSLPDGNCMGMAVYLNSGRMSRCVVSNVLYTASTSRQLTSVYLNNSAVVENSLITHCKSQYSNNAAVYLAAANNRVVNCTICNCTGVAAVRTGNADARVVNCAIFDNGNTVAKEWAGVNPGCFYNCAFYKAAVNDTLANGCLGLMDFLMDPEKANRPLQQSQLVDAGTDPSAWNAKSETDLDGNPRLGCGAVDIGCYEFTPTGLWCSAKASADDTVVGRTVTFTGKGGNGEGELTYTWDFGDGETETGAEVTHIYAAAGRYTVQLTVSDGTSSETCSVPGYLRVFDAEALYVKTSGNNAEGFGDAAHPMKDIPSAFALCSRLDYAPTIYVADNVANLAAQTMPPGVKLVGNAANRARTITLTGVLTMTNELNVVSNLTLEASTSMRMVRVDQGLLTDCTLNHKYSNAVVGNGPVIWQEGGRVSRCKITTGNASYKGATAATSHGTLVYAAGGVIENSLLTNGRGGAAGVATGALYLTNDAVAVNCTLGNCTTDGLTAGILIGSDEAQAINCLALNCGDTAELVWGNTHASQFKNCAFVESAACTGPGCITCPADVLLTVVNTTNFKPVAGVTVDAGDTVAYEAHATAAIDLTGDNRQQGASVDIGCYEYDNSTASVIGSTETRHTFLGEEITFAAKSAGTKGDVTYEWNMGNGDIFVTNVESFVYVYQRDTGYLRTSGVFTPKVTVIDDNGRSEAVSLPNQIHIAPRKIYVGGGTSVFPYDTPETAAANFNAIASLCRTTSSGADYNAPDLEIIVSGNFTEVNTAFTFSGANVKIYSTGPQWAVSLPQTITITGANCEIRNLKLIPTGGNRAISLNSTTAKIEDCYFYKTSTSVVGGNGGLIYMDNGQLIRCRLEGGNIQNSNSRLGANVYAAGNSIIDSCFITGARTGQANVAAGAVCLGGNAKIIGSTVAGNAELACSCRGIRLNSATAQAINCAVYNNGGTAAMEWGNANGANFVNCAFAAGCAPEAGTACIETLTDAAFADTVDYVPAAGSVLIGAGDADAATAAGAVSPTDLAGNPRTVGTRDIGAYERVSTVRATVADLFVTYDAAEHTLAAPTILEPAADVCTVKWADESGAFTLDAPVAQTAAGSYTNTVKIIADGYEDFTGTVVLEIKKRTLTVTAANKSATYGGNAQTFTVSYSGWATGEGTGNIDISGLTYDCAYELGTAVGSYKIYADGILADNYAIKYVAGTLTVSARAITVTPDAGQSKEYGAADPELTYTVTKGTLYGDDTLAGALSREAGETAGDYKITEGTIKSANTNYAVTFASTAVYFTINPSENAMILTLAPAGATYNGLDQRPVALVTKSDGVTPLVEGVDYELSGLSAPWVNAGTYTVTATGLGSRAGQSATATFTIARAIAPLGNIGFQDKTFDYDGQSHSIVINPAALPAGITVTYDGNGKTQPGEYPVTAHFDVGNNYEPVADRTVTMKITRISDWYVATTGSDENAGSDATTPFATIAKAISMVGATDTARIHLADGTYTEHDLTVNRAVEIIGNIEDATKVIIQAAATPVSGSGAACVGRVMTVSHAGAYVHHLTLRNGSISASYGGNLNLSNGLVADCRIESGYSTGASSGGGNVHANGGRVQRCVITDGRADTGNNAYGIGANVVASGTPVFENCLITAAQGGNANRNDLGAVYVSSGSPKFVNCTIAGNNTSVAKTRGVYSNSATALFINCVIFNNGGTAVLEWCNVNAACFVNCAFSAAAKFTGTAPVKTLTVDDFVDLDDYRQVPNTALADAGDNALYAQYALSAEDVRGGARTIGDAIDLGAYEVRGAVTGELTGYDEYEDGEEHTATLTITYPLDAATSTTTKWWSEADGDYTLDEAPKYSEPGNYTVKVKVTGNGLDTFEDEAQVIIHACSVVDATLEGVTVTYDQAAHQAAFTLTDPVDADVFWYNEETGAYDLAQQPAYVNAGVYTTKVEIAKYTYLTKRLEAEVEIKPVELTLAWGPTDLAYTGLAQAPVATLSGVLAGDVVEPVVTGAIVGPDADGTATVTGLSGAHADNYKLTGDNLSTPFSVGSYAGVVVTLDSPVLEYTGAVLDPGVKVAGINEAVTADMCTFDWGEQGEPKNAGTYELTVTRNDPLYAGKSVKVVVTVNQKPANIVWGPLELPFTGEPAAPSVTLDGIVAGDDVTTSVSGAQSAIGENYPAELTIGGAAKDNYLFSGETEVEFSIVDKDVFVSLSADGRISVIVKADVVAEDEFVYLAWDTEDKGVTMSDWANKLSIGTVTSEGGTFTADSAPLDIFTGYQVRAFIVAGEEVSLYESMTQAKSAKGYIDTGYAPGKTKGTSGFDLEAKFANMSMVTTAGDVTSVIFGTVDNSTEAATASGKTGDNVSVNFGGSDNNYMNFFPWPHIYQHKSYPSNNYSCNNPAVTATSQIANRGTLQLRTGEVGKWVVNGTVVAKGNVAWPSAITYDYREGDGSIAVFGRKVYGGDDGYFMGGDMTLYSFKIYEKKSGAHVCVRDYVPAKCNGKSGLYESKTGAFYPASAEVFTFPEESTGSITIGGSGEAIASDAVTYTRPAAGNPTLVCVNGAITVTVPKFLLAATGYPLVLAWDTSDQGADIAAWAHTVTIEDAVNGLGVTAPVDGFAEGIPAGSMLRAFVSDYSTAAAQYLAAVTVEWGASLLAYTGEAQAPQAKLIGVTDGDDVAADVAGAETEIGGPYTASVTSLTGADAAKYVLVGAPYTLAYGINAGERPPVISGADETIELDDAKVYVFNMVGAGALVTDKQIESADILIVGGGGAGASDVGGGGGGGGVVYLENQTLTAGTHPIVVGAGGAAPTTSSDTGGAKNDGGNGGDSSFADWIGKGGGGGGGWSGRAGKAGGCGGGGHNANGGATTQELYDGAGHGNASVKLSGTSTGTGGAGAGTANNGKTGGNGYLCSITGDGVYYGAGGGGGAGAGGTRGMGGLGGGGNGGDYNTARTAADDASGYGAGGGGGDGKANNTFRTLGGKGYQGIVIVRVANLASVSRLTVASTVDTVTTTVLPDNRATDDLDLVLAWDEDADRGEDLALWENKVAVAAAVTPVGGAYDTVLATAGIPDGSIVRAFLVKDDAAVDFSPAIQGGLKPVTIEWGATEFDYSGLLQAPSATVVSGLRDGDVVTVVVDGAQKDSGIYTATATGLSGADAAKYALTGDNLSTEFTIKEYNGIILQLFQREFTYNGQAQSPLYGVSATDKDLTPSDYEVTITPEPQEEVGIYTVRATRTTEDAFKGRYVEQTYEILPCPVTVTAQAATKVRLDADPAFPYTVEPALVGTNTFTGALSREEGEEVNTYGYLPGDLAVSGNYVMTLVLDEAVFTITERYPVAATVTGGGNFTYDEATTHTFGTTITTPATGVTVKWAHSDDLEAFLYDAPETFQDVGTYKNVAKFSADHYFETVVTGQIVIAQKPVSVTAASVAKTYGEDDPEFTYTLGQTIAIQDGTKLGRAAGENAGEYAINLGTLAPVSGNYVLQLSGTPKLTINPKPVTVTADAGPWMKVYGTDDPTFTYTLSETVATTGKLGRDAGETVAGSPYAINLGTLSAGANYTLSLATPVPEMTITKATYDMSGVILRDEVSCTVAQLSETPKPYEVTGTLPDGVTASYSGTGTTATEVGTYEVVAHFTGDAVNYEPIPDHTLELNVFEEIYPIAATVNDGSATYDGQMHGPSVAITDPAGGAGCTVVWIDENGTVCGETAPTYTKAGHHESTVTITAKGYEVFEQIVDTFIDDGSIEVMKTGADEGTGPFLTIGYALTVAKEKIAGGAASAKIRVYPGTYEENSLVLDAAIEIVSAGEDRSTVTVCNPVMASKSGAYQAGYTFQLTAAGAALRHLTIQGSFANGNNQNSQTDINGQCVRMTADGEVTDCEILNGVSGHSCSGGNVWMSAGRLARCYIHHGNGGHGGYNYAHNVYAEGTSVIENCLMANGSGPTTASTKCSVRLNGSAKMINCTVVKNLYGVVCGATTAQVINTIFYNTGVNTTEWGNANGACFFNCAFINTINALPNTTSCVTMTTDDFTDYANGDYTLKPESALVDVIGVGAYLATGAGELDVASNPRINGMVDIGAYEVQPDELTVQLVASTNNVEVGTAVTLTATALSAKGEVAWSWSVNDGEFAAGTATYEVTPSAEGITKVVAKATAGGETATAMFEVRAIAADTPVAEVWVGTTGIDVSGAGTELTPFATIAYAKAFLAAHPTEGAQTIHLLPGTYSEYGIVLDGAYIVQGEGESRDDVIVNAKGKGRAFSLSADGAALRDLTVQNGRITSGSGANISMTANGEISNCVIKDGTVQVLDGMGGNVYMTNGSLTDCLLVGGVGNNTNMSKGFAIYATGGHISRCEIRDAVYQKMGSIVVDLEGAVTFENSLITGCKAGSSGQSPYILKVNNAGARVVNCTVVGNTTTKFGVRADNASARIINTVIYDNGGSNEKEWGNLNAASFVNCAFGADAAYTGTSSTVLDLTDADFADYANGDYRPAAGGALEDAGNQTLYAANATSETDLANEPRFVGVLDLGAYEAQPTEFTLLVEASAGVIDPADSSVIKGTVFAAPGEVTWAWKVDNGDFAAGTATYALTGLPDGVHTITAKATAGGESIEKATVVRIASEGSPIAEVWVDSASGDDVKGAGVAESPFATIAHAKALLDAHPTEGAQTIHLLPGAYFERGITLNRALEVVGDPANPESVVVDADSIAGFVFKLTHADAVVRGLTVKNAKGGTSQTFANISGSSFRVDNGLVEDCIIQNTVYQTNNHGAGAYITGGCVTRCVFKNCKYYGSTGYASVVTMTGGVLENCLFTNNALYQDNAGNRPGLIAFQGSATVINCTIVNSGKMNAPFYVSNGTPTVINTVMYKNNGASPNVVSEWASIASGKSIKFINCAANGAMPTSGIASGSTGNLTELDDSAFVDYAGGDYAPKAGGALMNAGDNDQYAANATSETDLAGLPRVILDTIDIGCYEAPATSVIATLEDYEGYADGGAYGAKLTIGYPLEGALTKWWDGAAYTLDEQPLYTTAGTYVDKVRVTADGLDPFEGEATVILEEPATMDATLEGDEVTYDQAEHLATLTVTDPADAEILWWNDATEQFDLEEQPVYVDAGEHVTKVQLKKFGYWPLELSATVAIDPVELTLTWGSTELSYTGEAQAPAATVADVLAGDEVAPVVTGAATMPGNYKATVTGLEGEDAANYVLTGDNLETDFTIGEYAGVIVKLTSEKLEYTGAALDPGIELSGIDETVTPEMCDFVWTDLATQEVVDAPRNAGTYELMVSRKSGYDGKYVTATFEVGVKPAVLVWGETQLEFTDEPQAPSVTLEGLVEDDDVVLTVSGAETEVGGPYTATVELSGDDLANYAVMGETSVEFEIYEPFIEPDYFLLGSDGNTTPYSSSMDGHGSAAGWTTTRGGTTKAVNGATDATKIYGITDGWMIRTPTTGNYTFQGKTLVVENGSIGHKLPVNSGVLTINDLVVQKNGSCTYSLAVGAGKHIFDGNVTINAGGVFLTRLTATDVRTFECRASIAGKGTLLFDRTTGTDALTWLKGDNSELTGRIVVSNRVLGVSFDTAESFPGDTETAMADGIELKNSSLLFEASGTIGPNRGIAVVGTEKSKISVKTGETLTISSPLTGASTAKLHFGNSTHKGDVVLSDASAGFEGSITVDYGTLYLKGDAAKLYSKCVEIAPGKIVVELPPEDPIVASVANYSGTYDGQAHAATVTVMDPTEGYTITWDDTSTDATGPAYTDAGSYTNVFTVTAEGYLDFTGTGVVEIAEAPVVAYSAAIFTEKASGDTSPSLASAADYAAYFCTAEVAAQIFGSSDVSAIVNYLSLNYDAGKTALGEKGRMLDATEYYGGQYTFIKYFPTAFETAQYLGIVFYDNGTDTEFRVFGSDNAEQGDNYVAFDDEESGTISDWTKPKGLIAATVTNYADTYDGEPHAATVTVTEPATGYTITWDDDKTTGATGPAYTDAGSYTNVFTVTATGYLDFVGTGVVEIAETPVPTVTVTNATVTAGVDLTNAAVRVSIEVTGAVFEEMKANYTATLTYVDANGETQTYEVKGTNAAWNWSAGTIDLARLPITQGGYLPTRVEIVYDDNKGVVQTNETLTVDVVSGAKALADVWFAETAATVESSPYGTWANAKTAENRIVTATNTSFTANAASAGNLTVLDFTDVDFGAVAQDRASVPAKAPYAILVETNTVGELRFAIYANGGWTTVSESIAVPELDKTYDLRIVLDTRKNTVRYELRGENDAVTLLGELAGGFAATDTFKTFNLCGDGSLAAFDGECYDGSLVEAKGTKYWTIADALAESDEVKLLANATFTPTAPSGTYRFILDGHTLDVTLPEGWTKTEKDGVITITKARKSKGVIIVIQ